MGVIVDLSKGCKVVQAENEHQKYVSFVPVDEHRVEVRFHTHPQDAETVKDSSWSGACCDNLRFLARAGSMTSPEQVRAEGVSSPTVMTLEQPLQSSRCGNGRVFGLPETVLPSVTLCPVIPGVAKPANKPPVVTLSPSNAITGNSPVTLAATANDPEDGNLTGVWSIVSATNSGDAAITQAGVLTATQTDTTQDAVITYQYCATDSDGVEVCKQGTYTIPGVVIENCPDEEKVIDVTDSYFTNADFNKYTAPPDFQAQVDRAEGWYQLTGGTSDFFHPDGYMGFNSTVSSSPNGGGMAGFIFAAKQVKSPYVDLNDHVDTFEYVGQALKQPLVAGTEYWLKLEAGGSDQFIHKANGDRQIVVYGMVDKHTETIDSGDFNINSGHINNNPAAGIVVELGRETLTVSNGGWETLLFKFTPTVNLATVAIGGESNDAPVPQDNPVNGKAGKYAIVDNLLLAKATDFECDPNQL